MIEGQKRIKNNDFPREFTDISQIDDLIRKIKRENPRVITITWNPILYEMLLGFILFQGLGDFLGEKEIRYLGIKHKKSLEVEKYIIKKIKYEHQKK